MSTVFQLSCYCCHWLRRSFPFRTNAGKPAHYVCIENFMYATKNKLLLERNNHTEITHLACICTIMIIYYKDLQSKFLYIWRYIHKSYHIMSLSLIALTQNSIYPFLTPRYTWSEYSSPNLYRPHHSLVRVPKFHQPHLRVIRKKQHFTGTTLKLTCPTQKRD